MYNCARLAKLFENFEENVQKGEKEYCYKIIVLKNNQGSLAVNNKLLQYIHDILIANFLNLVQFLSSDFLIAQQGEIELHAILLTNHLPMYV